LSWTEKINHPNEVIDKDEEIEVVILAIDFENRRITLGHKQIEENPWEKFAEEYSGTNKVEGEVFKTTDKGVFVKLPYELEGFIPASKTEAEGEPSENFAEGDTVEAYVIELDETNKNITLSQREKDVKKAESTAKKSRDKQEPAPQTGTPTLGEMSGLADLKKEMADKEKAARDLKKKAEEVEEEENDNDEEE
jgi:small subunit ribosomal protein S1